jgi:hypothetical protein
MRRIPRLMYVFGVIYITIMIMVAISMDYNVKSIRLHDTVIKLKIALQDSEEKNQTLALERNTLYCLKNIYNRALSRKMTRPKKPIVLH